MSEHLYKIGKVSELTGLSVERLRMWEQRHEIRPTKKVNRIRFYDDNQLEKLTLIKELIDDGFSISELKDLTIQELKPLLGRPAGNDRDSAVKIALVGDIWNFEDSMGTSNCSVAGHFVSLESLCDWVTSDPHVNFDAIVLLVSSLDVEKIDDRTAQIDVPVFVVYKYASKNDLEAARDASVFVTKLQDTKWEDLVAVVEAQVDTEEESYTDFERFDEEQLEHLRRCRTDESIEPESVVEIIYLQRAIVEHLNRTTDSAVDIAVLEAVKASQNAMERALRVISDKHRLLV